MGQLNDLVKDLHGYAKAKGWWEKDRSPLEIHMLMVSELAEATEEVRSSKPDVYAYRADGTITTDVQEIAQAGFKPEGESIELVDVFIRLADYFGRKGWDLEELVELKAAFNQKRPHRHGGKAF